MFQNDSSTFDDNYKFLPHTRKGNESFQTWFYKACEMPEYPFIKIKETIISEKS